MGKNDFRKVTIFMLILSTLTVSAHDFEYAGLRFSIIDETDKTCQIDGLVQGKYYPDSIPAYVMHDKIQYKVTDIGPYAFNGYWGISSITIPNTVIRIGKNAFSECDGLINITLPESLIEIGDSAFWNCNYWNIHYSGIKESDITPITLPNGIKKIGNGAFQSSSHNCRILNIPTQVESIGDFAFYDCSPDKLDFPSTLKSIGNYAFHGSPETQLQIPSGITHIGCGAFSNMPIKEATLPSNIREIPANIFENCSQLESVSFSSNITSIGSAAFAGTKLSSIDIPESVTHIGDSAFYRCNLTSLKLPSKLTEIGKCLLYFNKNLTSVNIPENVTNIGNRAFAICYNIEEITIPEGVKNIGDSAFFQCHKLTDVKLPADLQNLGNSVFDTCNGLISVTLPNTRNISTIPSGMFHKCVHLKTLKTPDSDPAQTDSMLSIPNGIKTIGENAFAECTQIKIVKIPETLESVLHLSFTGCDKLERYEVAPGSLYYSDDDGVLFSADGKTMVAYPFSKPSEYTIPENVNEILDFAFYCNKNLRKISMSDNVEKIGNNAFSYCESLSNIIISKSLKEMGRSAFYKCKSLKEITLPDNLSRIERNTFFECSSLENVTFPTELKFIGTYAFYNTPIRQIRLSANVEVVEREGFSHCPDLEEFWIYCEVDEILLVWLNVTDKLKKVYYLSKTPQGNNYSNIDWGISRYDVSDKLKDTELYVLPETYAEIKNGNIDPWSYFKKIYTYDPGDDPYASIRPIPETGTEWNEESTPKFYNLNGLYISDTINGLSPGIYIMRSGNKSKKIIVR